MSEKTLPCAVDGCPNKVGEKSVTGLCKSCYASLYTWLNKRTARDRVLRAQKLKLWETRLCYALPDDKIQFLTTKKKYQPLVVVPGKVKAYRKRSKYKVVK